MNPTKKITLMALSLLLFACSKEQSINEPGKLVPMTADEDPSIPSIIVNGAVLHSEAFGPADSTLIICLHGGPGGDYRYMLHCAELADYGYRVVFYDQRGSGLSQRFSEKSYTDRGAGAIDLMYEDLRGVIAHYKTHAGQKVYLIGHSWGGMLATGFTGKYPQSVQGLVVSEPGAFKWDEIEDFLKEENSFNLWSEALNDMTYIDQFLTGKEDQHEILDYKLAILAAKNATTGEDNRLPASIWRLGAVINTSLFKIGHDTKPDFSTGIANYSGKVLFLYSEKNKAYTDDWANKNVSVFHSHELYKIPGVGHDGIYMDDYAWSHITKQRILNYFNSL